MKKLTVVILAIALLLPCLAACESGPLQTDEDKGAVVSMYMTDEMYNFDPALAYTDDSAVKILNLLFEGLMRINEKGKVEKALADTITYDEEENKMLITIKKNKWSDGRSITADDFVYAWKRILEPDFDSEACSMLYDIKNARAVKAGDMTIDDLGLAAIEAYAIEIEFEGPINQDRFIEYLASPALVPLREDIVGRNEDWAKRTINLRTNGPFIIRKLVYGDYMTLERSSYYYRSSNDFLNKVVEPYRFYIKFYETRDENFANYENGDIFFMGEIPLAKRAEYKDEAIVKDLLSTHSYYFNTDNKLFSDSRVRQALSLAIDRNAIADLVVFAKPAGGIVPSGVFENAKHKDFRQEGGELISPSADIEKAKSLLKEAGVSKGSFDISVRGSDEVAVAIAEYCAGVWETLGFNVDVEKLGKTEKKSEDPNTSSCYTDDLYTAYVERDFDVIAIDAQVLSTDPFVTLAAYAKQFSGQGVDLADQDYEAVPHKTGFDNEEYNALIEEIFAETDESVRAEKLHKAEEMLVSEMAVMPIVQNQNAFLASDLLSGFKYDWYGTVIFNDLKMKDYNDYIPETTEELIAIDTSALLGE